MSLERFAGQILGVGSASGVRVVVGRWPDSPFGPFADAMVERPDGHRVLLAPSEAVRNFVAGTYTFDETRIEPFEVDDGLAGWRVRSTSLTLDAALGRRTPLGVLLRAVPGPVAQSPAWASLIDPIARTVLRGVRTRGVAREGRREFYGASDVRAVTSIEGRFDGASLGELRPVYPPCRFGFSSTPRRPSLTTVVTTVATTH